MSTKQAALALGAILGSLALSSCDLDIPDLNSPGLNLLEDEPTVARVNTAATGLLVANRGSKANTTGIVNQLGILGREAYDFDAADARFVTELIQGNLGKASPFGGIFWQANYQAIRLGNIILHSIDKVECTATSCFTEENKQAFRGFTHTLQAMELLLVIITHAETGAVIDTDHPLGAPLAPFVSKTEVYTEIARLLDVAVDELNTGGAAFTFPLSPGYAGFNTPKNFLKVNRAIKARVAAYQATLTSPPTTAKYTEVLTALTTSFIDETIDATSKTFPATGAFHSYSTNPGDAQNGLINPAIFAHPKLETEAQKHATTMVIDARYTAKIKVLDKAATSTDPTLKTSIAFKIYPANNTPVPVIRNEELILLKAEALWFTGDKAGALTELNLVRTASGKLEPLALPATDAAFIDALLYERRYSLMYEGGHRWIDLKRFGRAIPLDDPAKHTANVRYPVPQAECDARGGTEPACAITSSQVL